MAGLEIEHDHIKIDGQSIETVRVPVTVKNGGEQRHVSLYAEDYKRLIAMGVTENWFINEGLVRFFSKGRENNSMVARVILGLWPEHDKDKRVHYRNGNKLNLLRHNLELRCNSKSEEIEAEDPNEPSISE